MHQFRATLERLDVAAYRVEKAMLLACVTGMTTLVFLQVVQRSFSREVGKSTELVAAIVVKLGLADAIPHEKLVAIDPWLFWSFAAVFMVFAVHASRRNRGNGEGTAGFVTSIAIALVVTAGFRGVIYALLILLPTGIPGAQKYALGLMLWAGMLGASIVTRTRGHIVIDAVKKKMGDDVIGPVSAAGGLLTATFCGVMAWLGGAKAWDEFHEWTESEHLIARLYESAPLPQAMVTAAIPVAFFLIGARFLSQGISDVMWGPPIPVPDEMDVIDLDGDLDDAPAESPESNPAMVFGRPHIDGGAR